jgi:23S rRNA (uracil1939-C5)-methyltransferase
MPEAIETRAPRPGDVLEVELERLDDDGRAVGRAGSFRVHVAGGLPGARVRMRVSARRRERIEGRAIEVLEPSPHAVAARCVHVASCGGCSFQTLDYPRQLEELGAALARALEPLARFGLPPIDPVIGCDEPWHYRNKMDFTFGARRWIEAHEPAGVDASFALGLHAPGRHDRVLDVFACSIAFRGAGEILASARRLARARGLEPWDLRAHTGLLRHVVLRRSWASGEILFDLVTSRWAEEQIVPYASELCALHPEISSFVQNRRDTPALVAIGTEERVLRGRGFIEESLAGKRFAISANSFFQCNTPQAQRLVALVREEARLSSDDVLFDLYCGAGAFALTVGEAAGVVVGFEAVDAAIADAERNARANGATNVRFVAGDLAATIAPASLAAFELPAPSVCVVDPPRAGMHAKVVAGLARLAPRRIVLVSCNPGALLGDLAWFLGSGYALTRVRPLDLFPHTPHLECVFTMERRG